MARIRSIKPSFWASRTAARISRDARLLALGLISMADDEGRFLASNAAIIGYVYPNDDDVTPAKLKRWLNELAVARFACFYEEQGIKYGAVDFKNHQRISHPQPSTYPAPPAEGLFE